MEKTFYSNGKLLITGEYVVLEGAKALALPTKYGQFLHVESGEPSLINWNSFDDKGKLWFSETITFNDVITKKRFHETETVKNTLIDILHQAYIQKSDFLEKKVGYSITTQLTFPRLWGLGTSSTLINNLANWLDIDAYELLNKSFGGSGYDIACAQNDNPLVYQLKNGRPNIQKVAFHPIFSNHIYFLYLNQKQNSRSAISAYYKKGKPISKLINTLDLITQTIVETNDIDVCIKLLAEHENIMSTILDLATIQDSLFPDFEGVIKSLGAWGGDFVMVVSKKNPKQYFEKKGYLTFLTYDEMIK